MPRTRDNLVLAVMEIEQNAKLRAGQRTWHRGYGGVYLLRALCALSVKTVGLCEEDTFLDMILSGVVDRLPYTAFLYDSQLEQLAIVAERTKVQFVRVPADVSRFCTQTIRAYNHALTSNYTMLNDRWREWTNTPHILASGYIVHGMKKWQVAMAVWRLTAKDPWKPRERLSAIADAMRAEINGVLLVAAAKDHRALYENSRAAADNAPIRLSPEPSPILPMRVNNDPLADLDVLTMLDYKAATACIICLAEITDQATMSSDCLHDALLHPQCFQQFYTQFRHTNNFGQPKCPKWGCSALLRPSTMVTKHINHASAATQDAAPEAICIE